MGKILGIIGGMGPLATVDLFQKIVIMTDASGDTEHIRIIIDNNTKIPDRTMAILEGGLDPLPMLIQSARLLESAGAEILLIACNTAHYYYDDMVKAVRVPILHMPFESAVRAKSEGLSKICILATKGTHETGIYQKQFDKIGIEHMKPDDEGQRIVSSLIYDIVKAGAFERSIGDFARLLSGLEAVGAEAFILGCTELPIAFHRYGLKNRIIDPTEVLASVAIERAGYRVRRG